MTDLEIDLTLGKLIEISFSSKPIKQITVLYDPYLMYYHVDVVYGQVKETPRKRDKRILKISQCLQQLFDLAHIGKRIIIDETVDTDA